MMSVEDLTFLYDHAKAYGGKAYALWVIAEFGKDDEIPDINHANQVVRYERDTGSSSVRESRGIATTENPAMTSKAHRNAFTMTVADLPISPELRREWEEGEPYTG